MPFGKENPEPMLYCKGLGQGDWTLRLLARRNRRISSLLAWGNGMELYAFWQGESLAYWLGAMRWDSTPFGKENPEPMGNGMGLFAFWRRESLAYAFTARAWGNGMELYSFW